MKILSCPALCMNILQQWYISCQPLTLQMHAISLPIQPRNSRHLCPCLQLNLYLMAFNLCLPAYPLDGGRIFADLLLICRVPVRTAAIATVVLAVAIAGGLIAWGIIEVAILTAAVRHNTIIESCSSVRSCCLGLQLLPSVRMCAAC